MSDSEHLYWDQNIYKTHHCHVCSSDNILLRSDGFIACIDCFKKKQSIQGYLIRRTKSGRYIEIPIIKPFGYLFRFLCPSKYLWFRYTEIFVPKNILML